MGIISEILDREFPEVDVVQFEKNTSTNITESPEKNILNELSSSSEVITDEGSEIN